VSHGPRVTASGITLINTAVGYVSGGLVVE